MVTIKLMITMSLLVSVMPSATASLPTSKNLDRDWSRGDGSSEHPGYESWVGWKLGGCLARGCTIFVGTLHGFVRPSEQQVRSADPRSLYYSEVSIRVDEWLYGEPEDPRPRLRLDNVPFVMSLVYGSEFRGSVWRDVELNVGSQLLIVFYPDATERQGEPRNSINRYGLVVSDPNLFRTIRDTVANHARYVKEPDAMLDAPSILDAQVDRVFSGYLAYYLYTRAGLEHPDAAAVVLSQLIGSRHFPQESWRLFETPLMGAMSNRDYPVSEATRNQVTEALVTAACSKNVVLAKSALRVLVILNDSNDVNMKPFLTEGKRRTLIKNYKELISQIAVNKGQAEFESQLGLRPR